MHRGGYLHLDVERGRVVALSLTRPGYKPNWALWSQ